MGSATRISIDPQVMVGRPVIRGTRVTVELILRRLSEGVTEADLLHAYPNLTTDDIHAALAYAADSLAHEDWCRRQVSSRRERGRDRR
jgi:Uncharacterized conserved protein